MAIRTYLTSTIGLSHLFMLNDATRDPGSTGIATTGSIQNGSFVADPVCEGVTNSFRSDNGATEDASENGFEINNTADINAGSGIWDRYSIMLWFKMPEITIPTCVYEQGGGTNNLAIIAGIARTITCQAADAGEPFLICESLFLADANRPYFVTHVWERFSEHPGTGNRLLLYVNGVFQRESESTSTAQFPNHSGNIVVGNANDNLKTYNESTLNLSARRKFVNMLGLLSDGSLTVAQSREIFERTVIPDITIAADTVENQQAALDLLIGNTYQKTNLAIRIVQATDATDYRLFIDNITFIEDITLRDIAIQYVGPNTLTIENVNGSNVVEVSTPAEVDLDGTTILPGGGNITIINNVVRVNTVTDQSNVIADKIVIENAGTYNFTNVIVNEIENVSGGLINVTSDRGISTVTNTGAGSTTVLIDSFLSFQDIDSWEVFSDPARTISLGAGTGVFNFQFVAATTYYISAVSGGFTFEIENTPVSSGETVITLNIPALIIALRGKMEEDHEEIKIYVKKASDNSEELNNKII